MASDAGLAPLIDSECQLLPITYLACHGRFCKKLMSRQILSDIARVVSHATLRVSDFLVVLIKLRSQ